MNDRLKMRLALGVDRHNRVATPEGPTMRSLRNLVLDDQNELVRRPSMEQVGIVLSSESTTGGVAFAPGEWAALLDGVGYPAQPLSLWLPPWTANAAWPYRSVVCAFKTDAGHTMLVWDGQYASLGLFHGRRPQAASWHGRLYIVNGSTVPPTTTLDSFSGESGLTVLHRPQVATGVNTIVVDRNSLIDIGAGAQHANWFTPKVVGTFADRLVFANFAGDSAGRPRYATMLLSDTAETDYTVVSNSIPRGVPKLNASSENPLNERALVFGDQSEEIVGVRELSRPGSGSADTLPVLIVLKERSVWALTGESLETDELGEVLGDGNISKLPIADGCPSNETACETPWGLIWAGNNDVWFLPNAGGAPTPIGRYIARQFENTPSDMRYLWHAEFHEGWYRLALMAPGQTQTAPFAMEEQWWLDLRYGPPEDWSKARWFGPQVYQPIIGPNGEATDIMRGTFIMAKDERQQRAKLLSLQTGWYSVGTAPAGGKYAFVLCGLDGKENYDWACEFSPVEARIPWITQDHEIGERKVVAPSVTATSARRYRCSVAGTSGVGEPAWAEDGTDTVDGGVTWVDEGKLACPGVFRNIDAVDGLDAFPTARSNEILAHMMSMDLDGGAPDKQKALRGLDVIIGLREVSSWDIRTWAEHVLMDNNLEPEVRHGSYILGVSEEGTYDPDSFLAEPVSAIAKHADLSNMTQAIGRHVAVAFTEYPYWTLDENDLRFSFWVDLNGDGVAETLFIATIDTSLTGYGFQNVGQFLAGSSGIGGMISAMNLAVNQVGVAQAHGTFSCNLSLGSGANGPVLPVITNDTYKWLPNLETDTGTYPVATFGRPRIWDYLGYEYPYNASDFAIRALHAPWARRVGKLRIAGLEAIVRLFKRGPV